MRTIYPLVLLFTGLLLVHQIPSTSAEAAKPWDARWNPHGPRLDTLLYKIILAYESRLAAFEAHEIDMVGVMPQDVERIRKNRPDAFFLETQSYTSLPLQFNLRREPLSDPAFRKAMAHIVDREGYVIPEIMKGYGVPLYAIVPPILGDWFNPNVTTYDYNLPLAAKILDGAGYKLGADGKRIDPKTGKPLRTLELDTLPDSTNPVYYGVALHVARQMEKLGIKVDVNAIAAPLHSKKVHQEQNFDMYFVGWTGLGPYPDWVWYFFHSRQDYKGGWNEFGVRNGTLDRLLDKFYYTLDLKEAKATLHQVQVLLQDILPWVPVATPIGITTISGDLKNLVLSRVPGASYPAGTSWLSDLNVYPQATPFGGTLKLALGQNVGTLNPGTFLWSHEDAVITYVYDFLTLTDPDDLNKIIPRLAESWSVDSIDASPGVKGTRVTVNLVKNATWQDGRPFTAGDVNFTIWQVGKAWRLLRYDSETIRNVYKTEVPNPQTIRVYINGTSWVYWLDILGMRPLPKHVWENMKDPEVDPSKISNPLRPSLTELLGTGPFIFKEQVPGSFIAEAWNPAYFMRDPEKGLIVQFIQAPMITYYGEPVTISLAISDYLRRPVNNATVTFTVTSDRGEALRQQNATRIGNATYSITFEGLPEANLQIRIGIREPLEVSDLSRMVTFSLSVEPVWKKYLLPLVAGAIVALAAIVVMRRRRKLKASQ